MSGNTLDALNSIESLVGSPPPKQDTNEITLEQVMRRMEELDAKIPSVES